MNWSCYVVDFFLAYMKCLTQTLPQTRHVHASKDVHISFFPVPAATSTPPLPVLPNAFQLRVEANLLDMNRTVVAEEFYDASNNRAAVHLFENNTLTIIIFDYINNQSFYFLSKLNIYSSTACVKDLHRLFFFLSQITSYIRAIL